ncbi:MAG: GNAT family N-acetyltransferase [Alphaproteobacteria bacterium]|nr:MAG: GNAT family N-acetyltransferase [Alphaproteobacteria bacterium]
MRIEPADFDNAQILALLELHLAGMHETSPPESVFALDLTGLRHPDVALYALWDGDTLLGFGALKALGTDRGEVKSMRTHPAHLRKGVAARLLAHILAEAGARGYKSLSLETGTGPAFEAAVTLYLNHGFTEGGPFADYRENAFSRFYHKAL